MWYRLLCVCVIIATVHGENSPRNTRIRSKLVQTRQGPIRGYVPQGQEEDIYVFYNIPYATVPTGADKFKAPLPPPTWTNVRHAFNEGIVCPQTMLLPLPWERREDCLVANIHVPITTEPILPVVVIVHTPAFLGFNSYMKNPNFLVDSKKVIAVTFNYRMGANGFLCLGTEFAPGNAGLKDQVALLRWVRENIGSFGGDPTNVTIVGCSSGVDLLVLSRMTFPLFHKVISDSQCSLSSSIIESDPLQRAIETARKFGVRNPTNMDELEDFYSTYTSIMNNDIILGLGEFMPCVEKNVGQEMFLDDAPYNILRDGIRYQKLPTLYGFSKREAFRFRDDFSNVINELNETFYNFLPRDLAFENDDQRVAIGEEVKKFYFGNEVNSTDALAFVNYLTDVEVYPILRAVSLRVSAENDQVYLYEYSFTDANSLDIPDTEVRGASSCDLFSTAFGRLGQNPTEERVAMAKTLRDLYVNFITTGNPTPPGTNLSTWLPVNSTDRSPHYSIGETIHLADVPRQEMAAFWDRIYHQLNSSLPQGLPVPQPPNPNSAAPSFKQIWIVSTMVALLAFK